MKKLLLVLAAALALSACTGTVEVGSVSLDQQEYARPVSGHYAALVQTGGWKVKTKAAAFSCSAWDFDLDLNNSYQEAMQTGLTRALASVDFIEAPLSGPEIEAAGYDAQLVVHQGNVSSTFAVAPQFFSGSASGQVELDVILAIVEPEGTTYQQTVAASGTGSVSVFTCPKIAEAVADASRRAVRDLTQRSVLHIRDALMSNQLSGGTP